MGASGGTEKNKDNAKNDKDNAQNDEDNKNKNEDKKSNRDGISSIHSSINENRKSNKEDRNSNNNNNNINNNKDKQSSKKDDKSSKKDDKNSKKDDKNSKKDDKNSKKDVVSEYEHNFNDNKNNNDEVKSANNNKSLKSEKLSTNKNLTKEKETEKDNKSSTSKDNRIKYNSSINYNKIINPLNRGEPEYIYESNTQINFSYNPYYSSYQSNFTNYLTETYRNKGESIVVGLGDTFDIFDNFYQILFDEHNLQEPGNYQNNYLKFFSESNNYSNTLLPRGFAYEIPYSQNDIFQNSKISSIYSSSNLNYCNDIQNDVLNEEVFIYSYSNEAKKSKAYELFRKEVEKCSSLSQVHILSNIFNGNAVGLLCSFINLLHDEYRNILKIAHLKYYDTFTHKAFSKRKNYCFAISHLYKECNLINLLNTPKGGDVMANLTFGDRVQEYEDKYSLNKLIGTLLIDPNANFVYSNGMQMEKSILRKAAECVFFDCKEGAIHEHYYKQYSSLCIYKGNKFLCEGIKNFFNGEINKIYIRKLQQNKGYYSLISYDKALKYDFVSNTHMSNIFKDMTEEYLIDFLQNYNLRHFSSEEKEMREETIYKVNEITNYYKEMWKKVN